VEVKEVRVAAVVGARVAVEAVAALAEAAPEVASGLDKEAAVGVAAVEEREARSKPRAVSQP